jgi:CHAD domain-containing protein
MFPGLLYGYCVEGDKVAVEGVKPSRLHDLRMAGKHLRYSLEIFRSLYGRRMDDLLEYLKQGQSDLGAISDATTTIDWLKAHHLHQTPEARQVRMFLEHRAAKETERFVLFWRDHWGHASFRGHWTGYLARYAGRLVPAAGQKADVERGDLLLA